MADPTCVYVMGVVDSVTVATLAVIVPVPDSEADVQPVRVHLDEMEQNIIGYCARTPGVDEGADPDRVFVPGTEVTVNPIVLTTPELPFQASRCVNQTVSTPAIPVYIPSSIINTPGAAVNVPAIELNILGKPATTPGKIIVLEDATIVGRPGPACIPRGCAACPPAWLTARAAPVSGPPRHLRSCPHPPHGLCPAYTLLAPGVARGRGAYRVRQSDRRAWAARRQVPSAAPGCHIRRRAAARR